MKKSNKCADCGCAVRRSSTRCFECYEKHRLATRKQYLCQRCGGKRSKHAAAHCMPCSKAVKHEGHLEECRYTRGEYEFLRSFGLSHYQTVQRLVKQLELSYSEVLRRLELAPAEEMAA